MADKTVYKYKLDTSTKLELPKDYKVVLVGLDPSGQPSIWIELDPEAHTQIVLFTIYGTGHPIKESDTHVASFNQGPFMWHLYRQN